nr:hypothetical protein [Lactococcus protaetiae]
MSDKLEKNSILLKNPWLSDVKIVAESESTQKDAKLDNQENCLYMTERQLATYGRFGRQYFAAEDGGIYMSLMLHPSVSTDRLPNYTLLTGAAVVSAIEKLTDKRPQIKWVNDIYLGKKNSSVFSQRLLSMLTRFLRLLLVLELIFQFTIFQKNYLKKQLHFLLMNSLLSHVLS